MKTNTIRTNVHCLEHGDSLVQVTSWPRLFPISQYVVRDTDGLTLVDVGIGHRGVAAVQALAQEWQQPVVRIVLTHAHIDHVGGLDAHVAAFPDAEVAASARTIDYLRGDLTLTPEEARISVDLPGAFPTMRTRPSRILTPGDRFGALEVIDAAGHTPDSIAFMDTRTDTLLVGDAFQTQGDVAVAGVVVPEFPVPGRKTWYRPMALEAARRMLALYPARLASGHGPVLVRPRNAMQRAINTAEARFATLAD